MIEIEVANFALLMIVLKDIKLVILLKAISRESDGQLDIAKSYLLDEFQMSDYFLQLDFELLTFNKFYYLVKSMLLEISTSTKKPNNCNN